MKILIAEDNQDSLLLLETLLAKWDHEVVSCINGKQAWERLQEADAPRLLILDWMMPEMDGLEVCCRLRKIETQSPSYVIMLTALDKKENVVAGFKAGADDYIIKPFNHKELRARTDVGIRLIQLQNALTGRIKELQNSVEHIKTLQGILPICSYCKKIRDDKDYWQHVETYISDNSNAVFSRSICPECRDKQVV